MVTGRSASLPHIRFREQEEEFPNFHIHTGIMKFGWKNSGKYALAFCFLLTLAILVPYSISLQNAGAKPLLPLISYSSENLATVGLINLALYIAALAGCMMSVVRFVHVAKENIRNLACLNVLNKLGMSSGFLSFFGLMMIASFPLSTPISEQEKWESAILIPHVMGAFSLFFFGALYMLIQTSISLFFYDRNTRTVVIRFLLFILCAMCFITSALSSIPHENSSVPNLYLQLDVTFKPVNEDYMIANVCEWLMVFFFCLYFLTFVNEARNISVSITFRQSVLGQRLSLSTLKGINNI